MSRIATLGFELVMATNQDGLGTESFPEETFWPVQNLIIKTLEGEGVHFDDVLIDRTLPEQNAPTRKPGTGMFGRYLAGGYDLKGSYVIGDRLTDVEAGAQPRREGDPVARDGAGTEHGRAERSVGRLRADYRRLGPDMAVPARRRAHGRRRATHAGDRHPGPPRSGRQFDVEDRHRTEVFRPHARPDRASRRHIARPAGPGRPAG